MIITDVRKRRGRLYQLYLDGEPAVTVDAAAFDESPYRMGGRIDDDQLRELLEAGSRRRAREKALYLLSMRDHSRGELEQKLRQTAGAQAAEETAARMDEAYARRLARDLLARKHYPRRRLAQELTGKGIDHALAEEAAAEAMEEAETDDGQQALELLRKKYYNRLYDENARRKTAAALARYGFGGDAVRRAMEAALSDQEDSGD